MTSDKSKRGGGSYIAEETGCAPGGHLLGGNNPMVRRVRFFGCIGLILLFIPLAYAHPLGNFAICHYSGLTVGDQSLTIKYIIDMAEIPAYQEIVEIDKDQNKELSAAERQAYMDRQVES